MTTVGDLLKVKGTDVHTVDAEASVFEALQKMADHDIGALAVLREGQLVGMMSERDYARKVILHGKASRDLSVADIMERRVLCVTRKHTMDQCMRLMTQHRHRHLPVIEQGELSGLVSIGDVVKSIIDEQQTMIEELGHYINGTASRLQARG